MSLKSPVLEKGNYQVVASYVFSNSPSSVLFSNAISYEAYSKEEEEDDFEIFNSSLFFQNDSEFDFDQFINQTGFNFQNDPPSQNSSQQSSFGFFDGGSSDFSSSNFASDMEDEFLDNLLDEEDQGEEDDNRKKIFNTGTGFPFEMKFTQWHYACTTPDINLLKLLQNKNSPGVDTLDSFSRTPLYLATYYNFTSVVEQLFSQTAPISMRPDPNICDNDGVSPIHLACSYGNKRIVEILVRNGAQVNLLTSKGVSPLYCSYARGFESFAKWFIKTYYAHENAESWLTKNITFYLWFNSLAVVNKSKKKEEFFFSNPSKFETQNLKNILESIKSNVEHQEEKLQNHSNNHKQVFEVHHGYPPNLGHYHAVFPHNSHNNSRENTSTENNLLCNKISNQFKTQHQNINRYYSHLSDPQLIHQNLFSKANGLKLQIAIFPIIESNPKQSSIGLLIGDTTLLYCSSQSLCINVNLAKFENKRPLALFPLSSEILKDLQMQRDFSLAISSWNRNVSVQDASGTKFVSYLLKSLDLVIPLDFCEPTLNCFVESVQNGNKFASIYNGNSNHDSPIATFKSLDDLQNFKSEHYIRYSYHLLILDAFERAFFAKLNLDTISSFRIGPLGPCHQSTKILDSLGA